MIRNHFSPPRFAEGVLVGLLPTLAAAYGLGVVALFASGRVALLQAAVLLGVPVVLALGMLRPEWTILLIVALPPSVISPIPVLLLVVIMLVALFGFLLQEGLRLGPKTGVYPLVGIIVLAITMKGDTLAEATAAADAMLKVLIYYTLLMLVAFHAAANGRMRIDTFLNALLLGIVGAAVLQPFVGSIRSFETITYTPFRGQFAYLAVMGFGVTYVRLSLNRSAGRRQSALDVPLTLAFLCLTAIGFGRATWIAALWVFALVSKWTGRKSFWIASSLFLVIVLTVPVVGERVLPGRTSGAGNETLARVTTGRSVLWGKLWERGVEAWPLGQGWGYVESLNSVDLFGIKGEFSSGGNPFIYPHNDFLYLFVQLGILGFGLIAAYWFDLFRKIRLLSHGRTEAARYGVRVLIPVIIVMFVVQLFDNGFAIGFVADRFFISAGFIFGLHYLVGQSERLDVVGSRFAVPSRAGGMLNW